MGDNSTLCPIRSRIISRGSDHLQVNAGFLFALRRTWTPHGRPVWNRSGAGVVGLQSLEQLPTN
ncbi:hypothetical protein J6590_007984 [Homalodisca vitripennis]|nr:hypothetical protein J6590_007984 [Homalodisca vitripennis]